MTCNSPQKEQQDLNSGKVVKSLPVAVLCFFLLLGIYFRLQLYFTNRSLWLDPAMLAVNVVEKSYSNLLGRLDLAQMAPVGFLFLTKVLGSPFGYSEYSLHFLPLLCGVFSMIAIGIASFQVLPKKAAFIPVGLLAFSRTAIYYSAEYKQYSSDMFFTLLIVLTAFFVLKKEWKPKSVYLFTVTSAIAVWFSQTAIMIQAGCGLALFLVLLKKQPFDKKLVKMMTIMGTILILNFLLNYILITRGAIHQSMFTYHRGRFAPIPFIDPEWQGWYSKTIWRVFSHPLGFGNSIALPLLALIVGAAAWYRKHFEYLLVLVLPLFAAYICSVIKLYPLSSDIYCRFVLFLLPIPFLIMALGIHSIAGISNSLPVYAIISLVFLFVPFSKARYDPPPYWQQETRPLINHIFDSLQNGDRIYVYSVSVPAFRYYNRFRHEKFIEGAYHENSADYASEVDRMEKRGRLWILFSHANKSDREALLNRLNSVATRVCEKTEPGAWLYCYEFHPPDDTGNTK